MRHSSSVGEHEICSAPSRPDLNPQPQLNEQQQVLKNEFGLNERVCASFNTESLVVQTFVKDLKEGKFSPNFFKKFTLWLSSKFGGPEYGAAVQQFRIETAAAKNSDLFKQEEFQGALAAAIKSCDSDELPGVLKTVYDLLSAAPEARRDFFIKELLIPCLDEAHAEMSKDEIDVKNSTKKWKNFSAINQFCLKYKDEISCSKGEKLQMVSKLGEVEMPLGHLALKIMYCAITANTENEKAQLEKDLSEIRKLSPTMERKMGTYFNSFDGLKNRFTEILRYFGQTQHEQRTSFRSLEDSLKSIANKAIEECCAKKTEVGGFEESERAFHDFEKSFRQKGNEFLLEKPELMWAVLKMRTTDKFFFDSFFLTFINFRGNSDDKNKFFDSLILQIMKNAMEERSDLTDEQVQLLCKEVNFAAFLGNIGENKADIDIILRFIQDKALSPEPKISFEDIMPANISEETCQNLLGFVEQGNYNSTLKDFIRSGTKQGIQPNP
jgi:hypothetical protein